MSLKEIRSRLSELEADLEWYKKYGEYINRVHPIIDAEAMEMMNTQKHLIKTQITYNLN